MEFLVSLSGIITEFTEFTENLASHLWLYLQEKVLCLCYSPVGPAVEIHSSFK